SALTAIPGWTFSGCSSLANLTIPASVTSIGDSAFTECQNLMRVIFLGDAPDVNYFAFPSSLYNLTIYFFQSASGFSSASWIRFPSISMEDHLLAQYQAFTYSERDTFIEIFYCDAFAAGELDIPSSINGKPVTSIAPFAFSRCGSLTSLT